MKRSFYIALVSALLTAGLIQAAPAFAQTADANVSIVRTADLDLASKAGKRTLDRRLVEASRTVCGQVTDVDPAGKNDARACRADTLAKARLHSAAVLAASNAGATIAVTASR